MQAKATAHEDGLASKQQTFIGMSVKPRTKHAAAKRKRKSASTPRDDDFPVRDCDQLFAQDVTVHCAMNELCVPCAYKICCFDVALDREFTTAVPNQRPEQCPRAKTLSVVPTEGTLGYRAGMNVLTVGDGDLSFSLALARLLFTTKGSNPSVEGCLIATSYESRETLNRVYPRFGETVAELGALGARVEYEVDATQLAETLHLSDGDAQLRFHRIVWNFPCTAISHGQDGQNQAMEDNKSLVRRFVQGARHLLHDSGEIHMSHKTKPPFNQWKLQEVAIENCKDDPAVSYCGRIVLDKFTLIPYTPRKALDRKSFPCHDACFYIFGVGQHKAHLNSSVADSLVAITKDVIAAIRDVHLGKHLQQSKGTNRSNSKKIQQ